MSNHDLDTRTYRAKYGIPQSQPLAARETAAKQAEALQARQAKDGRTSSKPPSIDGYGKVKRTESLRKSGDKPNGGQAPPDNAAGINSGFRQGQHG